MHERTSQMFALTKLDRGLAQLSASFRPSMLPVNDRCAAARLKHCRWSGTSKDAQVCTHRASFDMPIVRTPEASIAHIHLV